MVAGALNLKAHPSIAKPARGVDHVIDMQANQPPRADFQHRANRLNVSADLADFLANNPQKMTRAGGTGRRRVNEPFGWDSAKCGPVGWVDQHNLKFFDLG